MTWVVLRHDRWVAVLLWLSPLLFATGSVACSAEPRPLLAAHAHNDYHHPRPLLDALDYGFCSVEADVFEVDGELWIGHDRSELRSDRTLQRLYLDPLQSRIEQNGGRVYRDGPVFTLLVDIKSPAESTYVALVKTLQSYERMLVRTVNGQRHDAAVQVVLSGNRPIDSVAQAYLDGRCLVAIDGRMSDLDDATARLWMPLISDKWASHFRWRGNGGMPEDERVKLERFVQLSHAQGRRLRFWDTPDRVQMWQQLQNANVDLINTDDLMGLAGFLTATRD